MHHSQLSKMLTRTSINLCFIVTLALAAWLGLVSPALAQGPIIRVTPGGDPAADGSDWSNATVLTNALSIASPGAEIWVAAGVYTPGATVNHTFSLPAGVALYGGFAATETERTERDWTAHPTILSGDIGGDDTNTDGNFIAETTADIQGSNAYHVLYLDDTGTPISENTIIDGFTITAGQANGGSSPNINGAGLYCDGRYGGECSPSLTNVTFSGNRADFGGAMYNYGDDGVSSPSLTNVTFSGNSAAVYGGAMYNYGESGESSPNLTNVTFSGNSADNNGGAMYNDGNDGVSSPSLTNVIFSGNAATNSGGAMYNYGYEGGKCSPSLTNVTFSGNTAGVDGGAMFNSASGYGYYGITRPSLTNVTFSGNRADFGGAMYNYGDDGVSSPSLTNVILWGNTATISGTQLYNFAATPVLSYTLVQSGTNDIVNDPTYGGSVTYGPGILTTDPLFVDADGTDGITGTLDDNLRLQNSSPAIDAGLNSAIAGVATDLAGQARIANDIVDLGAYEANSVPCPTTNPIYVDRDAAGSNNGGSWANAFTNLQNGLSAARLCVGLAEIWVADGVYLPGTLARDTFSLPAGVALYGGFAATETQRSQRDWTAHLTILSGDIGGDDTNTDNNFIAETTTDIQGNNSRHILYLDGVGTPITANTIIDGFTITAGQADGVNFPNNYGGGLYCDGNGGQCSPSLANITFAGNLASSRGGAMYNNGETNGKSSPSLTNVTFSGNSGLLGGAMVNDGESNGESSPSLTDVTFSGNSGLLGGAMVNFGESGVSSPNLTNVTFSGNSADNNGGAMYNDGNDGVSSPSLTNVIFSGNTSDKNGGAMFNIANDGGSIDSGISSPRLTNVTFSGNSATDNGGAMYNEDQLGNAISSPSLTNVIMWGNTAGTGNQLYNREVTLVLNYTLIQSGTNDIVNYNTGNVSYGAGILIDNPLFVDAAGGNLQLLPDSPAIDSGTATGAPAFDIRGLPRPVNGGVDMGAYEMQTSGSSIYLPLIIK